MQRSANAEWRGDLKQGQGTINSESGSLLDLNYSFTKRFGDERGTNPEELIAAAHASCFAMALSAELGKKNIKPTSIDVKANVSLEKAGDSWEIPSILLQVWADVPGSSREEVEQCANVAKTNCPVSKLLKAKITMDFNLTSQESASMH